MEKTKFDLLFEEITDKFNIFVPSPYDEKVEELVHKYNRHDFEVVISKITDDEGVYFKYILNRNDDNPYYESTTRFKTMYDAISAAEELIHNYKMEGEDEVDFEDSDQRLPSEINDELS